MEKRSHIRVKAQILVQVLWHPAPGPMELVLVSQGSLKPGQTRIKLSIVPRFALSRCRSISFLSVDAVAVHICMGHCLLSTPEDTTHVAPLAGWLWLIEQCQKAHFWCHLCVLGRKWSPWDGRRSDHTCTNPALQFRMVSGVMSLMRPQKMNHVPIMIEVFPMHQTALVQIHWRLLIIIMEYNGTLNMVTYRGEWVLMCLGLQE